MSVASLSPALTSAAQSSATSSAPLGGQLDQTTFMKMLVAEMQNQDPLNPTSSTDFISQLSQLSTVQGVQQLNSNFANMLLLQQLTQGANLVGKQITFQVDSSGNMDKGVVDSVQMANGQMQLLVAGKTVALSQVRSIQTSGASAS
jgi:flagellar basal-body rod modification protein FlgD